MIFFMLESRNIITTLSGETLMESMAGSCLREGALLPFLWSLIANKLLWEFKEGYYYTVDDIAVLVN
jgi:hypothetical protein